MKIGVRTAIPFAGLLALLFASFAWTAPDENLLGKAEGYPICKQPWVSNAEQRCLVGNLSNYDSVVPARTVRAGQPRPFKRADKAPEIRYPGGDIEAFLAANRNTGLLILKGDTVLVERYQYDRKATDRFQSFSMAKTVVAMLMGIAVADGNIGSIDELAQQYLPQLKGHPYGETRLRDLLTMSSGVRFSEEYDGRDDTATLARLTLAQRGPGGVASVLPFDQRERPAGTKFHYASAETEVLALVLRAAVRRPLAEYLSEKIWQPMGAEADAAWLIDRGGYELGYAGLNATLRDWGRLGMLLANYGALNGRQIIPADWVWAATHPDSRHLRAGQATAYNGYGFQTWLLDNDGRFALLGVRGQAVFVDPKTKVVVVHTSAFAQARDPEPRKRQYEFFSRVNKILSQD